MKLRVFIFILMSGTSRIYAAESLALSYKDLGEVIRQNNKSVRSLKATEIAARSRTGKVESSFLPKFGLETGIAEQREANGVGDTAPFWKVDVSTNLYRGGRDKLGVLVRESQLLIKEMDTQVQFRSELFKAKLDYIRLYQTRKAMSLVIRSMDDFEGLKKSIVVKAKAGLMTSTSADALELEVGRFRRDLIILKGEESELEDRLLLVLGLSPDQSVTLDAALTVEAPGEHAVSEGFLVNLPEIKRFTLLTESRRLESSSRSEWWLPDVSAFAAYTGFRVEEAREFRSLPEQELVFGLRFTVDLEGKKSVETERSGISAEAASYEAQKDYLRREVEHKVHEYNREIKIQTELMKASDESIGKTTKLLGRLRSEFEKGVGSNAEVAEMIRVIYQTHRLRLESEAEILLASAGLETMASL